MSTKARLIFLIGIILLGLASVGPLWRIEIFAPQYPEGLFLQINTDRIDGNVDQINILNHYIGMKKIVPSQIPELRIIPKILYALIALGFLAVLLNHLIFARAWLGSLLAVLAGGLVDFYAWGYDYGHNLDPHAPIQMPGLSYQPPLVGHKTLLNIQSYSLPDWGGWILFLAVGLLIAAVAWDILSHRLGTHGKIKPNLKDKSRPALTRRLGAIIASFLTLSCTVKPDAIKTGTDHCEKCRMTIVDGRFGGEIITDKGRVYKFDSLDCLLGYHRLNKEHIKQVLVIDFMSPGKLVDAGKAYFIKAGVRGPMGTDIVASADRQALIKLGTNKNGATGWADLLISSSK